MLEFDPSRARIIQRPSADEEQQQQAAKLAAAKPSFGVGRLAGRLLRGDIEEAGAQAVGVGLSGLYRQLDEMGFQSGGEFKAAVDEAEAIGASILLGDRDARVTVRRLRDALVEVLRSPPPSELAEPPAELVEKLGKGGDDFSKENIMAQMGVLKQRENTRQLVAYLKTAVPPLYTALIDERDAYMAQSLMASEGKRIVAVVGLAHVDGIEARLKEAGTSVPQRCVA